MPEFSPKDVQSLRRSAGVGMLDAKRALEESGGVMEDAVRWLREKGLAKAASRDQRDASQGAVAAVREGPSAAIVELRCETDFVAKSPEFVALVDDLAALVAEKGEAAVDERKDVIDQLRTSLQENISVGRVVRMESGEGQVLDRYVHQQAGRGVNAVIVLLQGGTQELAHDVAVHIAFARPEYLRREDVPEDEVAAERATVEQISRNEGKPEAALEKVVEGRMTGWFKERVLLEQAYVRDEKRSISDLLGSASIVQFAQVVTGS
ncbi:MAG TPA: translation elongation factor Ts [Acidimicrobiales bacterium]|nr:translation elongation factor Ts [Acidimicrobiales bacterium]